MSEQFVKDRNNTMVNLRHIVALTDEGDATLSTGGKAYGICQYDVQDHTDLLGVVPASDGTVAVVIIGGRPYYVPVVAWRVDNVLGALAVLPRDIGAVEETPVGILAGGSVFYCGEIYANAADFCKEVQGRQEASEG